LHKGINVDKFKSGELHEKHAAEPGLFGTISEFA
jgi:hypothetical protein